MPFISEQQKSVLTGTWLP